jgi:miniconductance mechanosensitive channel
MQKGKGRRVKRTVYFDFRSIHVVDESLRQQLIDKKLVKAEEIQEDSVNLTLFRYYMEAYLKKRTGVNPTMTLMVRQLESTQWGLPIEFYFFVKNKEWVPYEHILADIMEYVYATAPQFGLRIYQRPAGQ